MVTVSVPSAVLTPRVSDFAQAMEGQTSETHWGPVRAGRRQLRRGPSRTFLEMSSSPGSEHHVGPPTSDSQMSPVTQI